MKKRHLYFLIFLALLSLEMHTQNMTRIELVKDELAIGFQSPPNEAKARTWWHWISGNVSKTGITADLEAMKKVGIQEAQLFNVDLGFPSGSVTYLSPEWLELFKFSAIEAKRLGMELTFHNGAGWSSSGGPWITPEYSMQTVVYSEIVVAGGTVFKGDLPQPKTQLNYYKDIAVFAFPKPKKDLKIDGLDYKNLSDRVRNHLVPDIKNIPADALINKKDIIDLTSKVSKEGFLEWKAPKGEWVILRMGHTSTGKKNHPSPAGGLGLECDKMSKKAVDVYWKGGIQPIITKLGDLIGTVVNNCLIDSYEVGNTNWTVGFNKQFETLRGYDIMPYLPTLAGYYVDSGEITERFLWDFRRTIGDLMAENYYAHFGELCHKNNLKFSVEPYWGPFDNMQVGATGDIVMCEFWSGGYPFFDSPKFVSSIAHLNGSAIVGAEAFTGIGGWDEHPALLKTIGDKAWAQGINRFIFHTYVHQPWDVAPGLELSYHGTDFNRLNTWWNQGKAFMDYIGRSQFLLQQGKSVNDVLVFTGESSPNIALLMPEINALGYDYDLIGVHKLMDLTVKNGEICTPVGGKYKVLVLPQISWIRPETLQKIQELALAGATIIGEKPLKSPSLNGFPNCDVAVTKLTGKLWDTGIIKNSSVVEFLEESNLLPDYKVAKGSSADLSFMHRKTEDADIYFIANAQKERREEFFQFRVAGKQPELWNAETGTIEELVVWNDNGNGTTTIPVQLGSEEAVFIVFRKPIISKEHIVNTSLEIQKTKLEPLSNLKIIKAAYGTFLQEGLVDITEIVAKEVKDNKLNIFASRAFCDCDPAMGYKKEFRLEYSMNGVVKNIIVEEKEAINIDAEGKGELKVLKAVFGKFKPETRGVPKHFITYEITEKIKSMVSLGNLEIFVDNQLIDGKTAEGDTTSLQITYTTDGEERTVYIPKGQTLKLSKDITAPKLSFIKGETNWITPYPGTLTYSTNLGNSKTIQVKKVPEAIYLKGAWDVTFQPNLGAPKEVAFNELTSWSVAKDEGIRYFSGTASYKKQFELSSSLVQSKTSLELDLGSVAVIAEVIINGKNAEILWKAPFKVVIDDFVQKGTNTIEIKVTNLWPNRLIGDEQLPLDYERKGEKIKSLPDWLVNNTARPTERQTFSSWKHWGKDSDLLTSGLLGPVKINISVIKNLNLGGG